MMNRYSGEHAKRKANIGLSWPMTEIIQGPGLPMARLFACSVAYTRRHKFTMSVSPTERRLLV